MVLVLADWLDYPGFEAWRFINLFLFIAGALLLHRWRGRPIREKLCRRRETIKLELESSRQRKQAAAAELAVVEARLAVDVLVVATFSSEAVVVVEVKQRRWNAATEDEDSRLRTHAERDVANLVKNVQMELRQFAAEQGVQAAETLIRRDLDPAKDARLIKVSAGQFGGMRH